MSDEWILIGSAALVVTGLAMAAWGLWPTQRRK